MRLAKLYSEALWNGEGDKAYTLLEIPYIYDGDNIFKDRAKVEKIHKKAETRGKRGCPSDR